MDLNSYKREVQNFLKGLKDKNWSTDHKISELGREYEKLKSSITDKELASHQIYDMLFILFEISCDLGVDIEKEWQNGKLRKQKRYL